MDTVDALRDQRERHEKWTQVLRDQNARLRSDNERMREALAKTESWLEIYMYADSLAIRNLIRSALSQGQGEG